MKQTVYVLTPVSEKPETEGYYLCTNDNEGTFVRRGYFNGEWLGQQWGFTHWYRPDKISGLTHKEASEQHREIELLHKCITELYEVDEAVPIIKKYLSLIRTR